MSDLMMGALDTAAPLVADVAQREGASLLNRFTGLVQEGTPAYLEIVGLFRQAVTFQIKGLITQDPEYSKGVETLVRRARTLACGEAVVASDSLAAQFESAMNAALSTVASVALAILGTVVKNLAAGAVAGLTGGTTAGAATGASGVMGLIGALFTPAKK